MTAERRRPEKSPRAAETSEDAHAFREAMRGVKPIAARPTPTATATAKPRAAAAAARARAAAVARARALDAREPGPPLRVEPGTEVADRLEFRRAGVRDRQYLKLRRGGLHAEDRLDLHGLTQADAQPELEGFLEASRARGLRCVLVVHGKGMRSAGRGPVLKAAVDLWLRRHNDVLAFATARPIDGGGGALYVLLRA